VQSVPSQLGNFRILRVLGRGRTGDVYEAEWGPRRVAVKVVHQEVLENAPADVAELKRHAELLRALAHPSLVKVLTVGDLPDGRPYLVMEQLDGRTLDDRLRGQGPVAHDDALRLFGHAAGAVGALHEAGLVHSDIQPKNVFLVDNDNFAVLLGVGVAKPTGREGSTTTGWMRGAPAWMAPERMFGAPARVASDVYELGLLLYCMVCGRQPWTDPSDHQARQSPASPSQLGVRVPKRTERAIMAALSMRPEERPRDVAGLLDQLGCAPAAPVVSKPPRDPIKVSSIVTALLLAAALGVVVFTFVRTRPASTGESAVAVADAAVDALVPIAPPPDAMVSYDASLADDVRACEGGDGPACWRAGTDYAYGTDVDQDFARGAELLSRGCHTEEAQSCALLGRLFLHGQGVDKSSKRAIELYTKACDISNARDGCRQLGGVHEDGDIVPQDLARAHELYTRACDAGDGSGCANLGRLYGKGAGVEKDPLRAVELYEKGCAMDNPTACYNWAHVLRFAIGVEQDYVRAAELYRKACDGGDGSRGCESLGQLHAAGQGVPLDYAKAAELYRRGCDARDGSACKSLANAYEEGRGVVQDYAQARELYDESCKRTDGVEGCNNLGRLYYNGELGEVDDEKAASLFKRACNADVDVGCFNLGLMRENKRGGVHKMPEARTAYKRACDLGYAKACKKIGRRVPSPNRGG
jgi:hypothetical protein